MATNAQAMALGPLRCGRSLPPSTGAKWGATIGGEEAMLERGPFGEASNIFPVVAAAPAIGAAAIGAVAIAPIGAAFLLGLRPDRIDLERVWSRKRISEDVQAQ